MTDLVNETETKERQRLILREGKVLSKRDKNQQRDVMLSWRTLVKDTQDKRLNKVKFDRHICQRGISRGEKWGLKMQEVDSQSDGFHRTERRALTRPYEDRWLAATADCHRKGPLSMQEEARKTLCTDTQYNRQLQGRGRAYEQYLTAELRRQLTGFARALWRIGKAEPKINSLVLLP